MEKEKSMIPKKVSLLVFFILSLTYNSTFSQTCTNPTPGGDASQDICKMASTIDDLIATGGNIVWYDASIGGVLYDGLDVLINGNTYYADDISGGSCSDPRLAVTVTIYGNFPTNVDVLVGKCAIDNPTIDKLSATGQNIEWYDLQIGGNLLLPSEPLVNGTTYWVQQTENGCVSDRLPTTVSLIDPIKPTTSLTQSICYQTGSSPSIGDLQPSGATVLWYASQASLVPLKNSDLLINGNEYWAATLSFPCVSTERAQTTVFLEAAPNAGTDGSYPVCEINLEDKNLFSFLGGTPDAGGTWTAPDGSAHSENFIAGTDTEGIYTYTVIGGTICPDDTSTVTLVITVVPPPTITDTDQSFCIVDLPSSPTLAELTYDVIGSGNSVNWYDSQNSTVALPLSTVLTNNTTYWASQVDPSLACESATRDSKTALIEIASDAGTDGSYSDCEISLVDTNLFSKLGGSPDASGTWTAPDGAAHSGTFLAASDVAGDYTYTVAGGTICPNDTAIVTVAITVVPAPTITDADQSFCIVDLPSSPTLADLTVDTVGAGNDVIWYDSQISTVALPLSTVLTNNSTYWASQLDPSLACESATRDSKTALIEIAPNAGTDGSYSDCEISLVDTNLFSKLGGSPDASGTWTAPDGAAHSGTFLAASDVAGDYTYTVAGGTICPNDTAIVTVAITVVPAPTIAETTQTFCKSENALVSDLIPNVASIIWHDATGTVLAPSDTLSDGTYSASQTNDLSGTTCESVNRTDVTVIIYNPTTPTTTQATQEFCLSNNPTIADLQAEASNAAYSIVWYDATGSAPLTTDTALIDGATYNGAETISNCESAGRLAVTVTINDALPPTISTVSQIFCASSSPEISDLIVSGTGIVWYASETDNTPLIPTELLVDSEDYWAAQTNAATGCISSIREVANVTLTDPGTPAIISLGNEFCKIDKPTLAELNINVSANSGGTISWYDSYPNGNLLGTSIALVEGETYYAIETTVNSCESINPLAVTVSLEACDAYDVEIYDGFSPSGNGVNDTFKLGNLRDLYPNFNVEFFNRWGGLVYTANASKPDWNGRLNGDGELVPAGVYYFIINFNKNDRKPIQRRLYLSR